VCPNESDPEDGIVAAVQAVRAGDLQAYATIVKRFQASLTTLCMAILRDRQAAEALAEDVFVRAFRRLGSFDVRRPMKPWLATIACRLAQEGWRAEIRQRRLLAVAAAQRDSADREPSPSDQLLACERSETLWRCIGALPVAQRTAVVLYYRENLNVDEVAGAMRVAPGTVKTHLFRARAQIKECLLASGFDEGDLT
jgi:RNA polymerase sigma-70 factor (ECF subfamily)